MSDRDKIIKEICELLIIWHGLKNTQWPAAKTALEERINDLGKELGLE